jgi:competence protein ComEC
LITHEIKDGFSEGASMDTLASSTNLSADILIAPHHGSKTSSTNVFIEHVAPKAVIFTQGYENRWQFPAYVVAKRYERLGVTKYLTSYHGYISATFDKDSFHIDSQRGTLNNRWYLPGIAPRHLKD